MAKFKIGSVVALKSGGPDMTIVGESDIYDNGYEVKWFDMEDELKEADFPEDALDVEDEDDEDEDDGQEGE